MRIALGPAELLDQPAGVRIGDVDVRREEIALRHERDVIAVGAHGGRDVLLLAQLLPQTDDCLADRVRLLAASDLREIHRAIRRGPLLRERVVVDAEDAHECRIPTHAQRRPVHVDDCAIAPLAAHVGPQRLTVTIREESRIRRQLLDRRKFVSHHRVAHPHRRERILTAE